MLFKDQIASDAVNVFLNSDEFAESISYTPRGGVAKIVKAIVNRGQVVVSAQDTQRLGHDQIEIFISTDSTNGIQIVSKQDTFTAPGLNGAVVPWGVIKILDSDPGMWHLLAEK